MKLENGYKVIYEVIDDTNRTFKASKTGSIVDAEVIAEFARGSYKLVYQRGNKLFGSVKNVPTDEDVELTDFDKVFVEKLNLSEILRNSGIRLSDASNTSENQSPIKSR